MIVSRGARILICAAVAFVVTTLVYLADTARARSAVLDGALKWARQVSSQAEGMALDARQKGEADPIGWATGFLTQGVEPRVMRIYKYSGKAGQSGESFKLDGNPGMLDYTKILTPEDGSGVRIQILTDYLGFFGARSKAASDLLAALLFGACWAILGLAFARTPTARPDERFKAISINWVRQARKMLVQLGIHVREVIREAQNLAKAAAKSRSVMTGLRDQIHAEIRAIRESRAVLKDGEHSATEAEVRVLNLMIQALRMGEAGKPFVAMAEELHRLIRTMHQTNRRAQGMIQRLELKVEPWATDADMAYHSYDDVFRATQDMDAHIRKTTALMVNQSKLIQRFEVISGAEPTPRSDKPQSPPIETFVPQRHARG